MERKMREYKCPECGYKMEVLIPMYYRPCPACGHTWLEEVEESVSSGRE